MRDSRLNSQILQTLVRSTTRSRALRSTEFTRQRWRICTNRSAV